MRILIGVLLFLLLVLQYRLWVGEGSLAEVHSLREQVELQKQELEAMRRKNEALQAEVQDLKQGQEAVEERARHELGMARKDETFYQVIEGKPGEKPKETAE
jgi:cell division protein FtsB